MIEIGDYTVDLYELLFRHVLIGLVVLFIVLRIGLADQNSRDEIDEKLGMVILTVVLFWPYNVFCWVMSWPIWLMPVSQLAQLFKRR